MDSRAMGAVISRAQRPSDVAQEAVLPVVHESEKSSSDESASPPDGTQGKEAALSSDDDQDPVNNPWMKSRVAQWMEQAAEKPAAESTVGGRTSPADPSTNEHSDTIEVDNEPSAGEDGDASSPGGDDDAGKAWQIDIADDAGAQADVVETSDYKRGQRFKKLYATLSNPAVS
jgi:hypothetical protein